MPDAALPDLSRGSQSLEKRIQVGPNHFSQQVSARMTDQAHRSDRNPQLSPDIKPSTEGMEVDTSP
jgi:hypothetical protein